MDIHQNLDERKVIEKIKTQLSENSIILYMKGTPDMPQCGFSNHAVNAIRSCSKKFAFINILEAVDIRMTLPKYKNWPTFPQLYVNGELIGGCDIILELQESGELQSIINSAK